MIEYLCADTKIKLQVTTHRAELVCGLIMLDVHVTLDDPSRMKIAIEVRTLIPRGSPVPTNRIVGNEIMCSCPSWMTNRPLNCVKLCDLTSGS